MCCINCTNRNDRGYRLFRFPAEGHRRQKWIECMNRGNWTPTKAARICEVHFESSQFEQNRADGWKKLKQTAIPTLFNVPSSPTVLKTSPTKTLYEDSNGHSETVCNVLESENIYNVEPFDIVAKTIETIQVVDGSLTVLQEQNKTKEPAYNQNERSRVRCNSDTQRPQQKERSTKEGDGEPPKSEKIDEEIEEMAKKIRMENKQKLNLLKSLPTQTNGGSAAKELTTEAKAEDWTSVQGRFGWTEVANTTIPYLTRSGKKYISLRMAENKILKKFKNMFTDEVRGCFCIKILNVTSAEAQLLNEINFRHCDNLYGSLEFTMSDGIISIEDLNEMFSFLNFCQLRLIEKVSVPQNRCGFIQVGVQNCVPYVWKADRQYVPLFYFEGGGKYLEERSVELSGWDLVYLKLYCKIQGIRKDLYDSRTLRAVELELVKKFFPPDTVFEETWPTECTFDTLVQRPVPKLVFSQNPASVDKARSNQYYLDVANKAPAGAVKNEAAQKQSDNTRPVNGQSKSRPVVLNYLAPVAVNNPVISRPKTAASATPAPDKSDFQRTFVSSVYGAGAPLNNYSGSRPNRTANVTTTSSGVHRLSRVLQIPEVVLKNAYFILRIQVEDKYFQYCINMEPFVTSILLVSLEECAVFFQLPIDVVIGAVNVMHLDIFLPNKQQRKEFEKLNVYTTRGLLKMKDFTDNLPQLRYILSKSIPSK